MNQFTGIFSKKTTTLLTTDRFASKQSEVHQQLHNLLEQGQINEEQLTQVIDEDKLLKIKLRTRKKCVRKLVISILLISFGVIAPTHLFTSLAFISGIILFLSSFFGILLNRISKEQMNYLNR